MIIPLVPHWARLGWRASCAVGRWMRRHPRWSAVIVVATWFVISETIGAVLLAHADDGSVSSVPYLPQISAKDSGGVNLLHYATLPLDRGDVWTLEKKLPAALIDQLWAAHLAYTGWVIWLFHFMLSFKWVDWISTPISALADLVNSVVSQIGWIPLALAATALICGGFIMNGRMAKGLVEMAISVAASVLAVGLLANPVAAITGPNGALPWVESWGGQFAAAAASGSSTLSTDTPSKDSASKVLTSSIDTQLMDAWVRYPAQEIAFGHDLKGKCAKTFSTAMKKVDPIDTSDTSVRDAVHGCDKEAWTYVTHPGFGQVITALIIAFGSGCLALLGVALAILMLMCVVFALGQALKLVGDIYAAVLPGVARESLWKSLIGMYVSVLSVGFSIVLLAGFLYIITKSMKLMSAAKMSMLAQMGMLDFIIIVLIISIFIIRHKAKVTGESLAARLSRLGFGSHSPAPHKPSPILQTAKRVGQNYLAEAMRKRPEVTSPPSSIDNRTINVIAAPHSSSTSAPDTPHFEATTVRSPNAGGPDAGAPDGSTPVPQLDAPAGRRRLASGAMKAIGVGSRIALAASTGGTSAAVTEGARMAGGSVAKRAITAGTSRAAAGSSRAAQESDGPSSRNHEQERTVPEAIPPARDTGNRQIIVGKDGTGKMVPREAPQHGATYKITSMPDRPGPAISDSLRQRLASAARTSQSGVPA